MRAVLGLIAVAMCAITPTSSAQTPREQTPLRDVLRVGPGDLVLRDAPVAVIILGNPHWWERLEAARTAARPPIVFTRPDPAGDQDVDGDGFLATAFGGNDCNDHDRRTYPGNTEQADEAGHDEDCDPTTIVNSRAEYNRYHGEGDSDGDGFVSYRVFNFAGDAEAPYAIVRGPDCNDSVRSINPNASELTGDHVDNNCNGEIDEPLPAAALTDYVRPVEGMMSRADATRR